MIRHARHLATVSRLLKKKKSFSRGIQVEQGDATSLYDRMGYWDSSYKEINVDDSLRHGILIPQIPFESIGAETQTGRRPHNEDKLLLRQFTVRESRYLLAAVFDGHGNDLCAQFCIEQLAPIVKEQLTKTDRPSETVLKRSMRLLDDKWTSYAREQYEAAQREEIELELENDGYFQGVTARQKTASSRFTSSGTTATVVLIEDGYLVYYCWVGDSRAILCRNGVAKRLTFEHSLEAENPLLAQEVERIESMGGVVMENNGIKRVYAGEKTINMTRALGDLKLKEFGISPEPSSSEELPKGDPAYARLSRINHNNDSFIVLITDGISGPLTAKEVVDTIHSKPNARQGARHLVDTALHLGSQDNCTAVVIPLGAWGKYKSPAHPRAHIRHFLANQGRY